jgi:catechol 2,3-dioxygenase-like lactoylglutathione lyase family enzyme
MTNASASLQSRKKHTHIALTSICRAISRAAAGCSPPVWRPYNFLLRALDCEMSVQVYGCNHVAIEVDDIKKAITFYKDVFNLEELDSGEGDAFFKLGEHQFLAIFEVKKLQPVNMRHFGIMVRDEQQIAEVRKKITGKYKLKLEPPFRCDFRDPWGNRIQVVDLHDESLVWLLPYGEVQKVGIKFEK